MATTAKANKNNFIRWNRITGSLTLAQLQALAGTCTDEDQENTDPMNPENDGLPLEVTEGSNIPSNG